MYALIPLGLFVLALTLVVLLTPPDPPPGWSSWGEPSFWDHVKAFWRNRK